MPADRVRSTSPWHLVFVLDDSGSMEGEGAAQLREAVRTLVEELKLTSAGLKPYFKVSLIRFGSSPETLYEAASEQTVDPSVIDTFDASSGTTNVAAAFDEAHRILSRNPGKETDFTPYVFFFSDGMPDDAAAALAAAERVKTLQIAAGMPRVVSIGLGEVDDDFMSRIASKKELYKHLHNASELTRLLPQIGTVLSTVSGGSAAVDQAVANI